MLLLLLLSVSLVTATVNAQELTLPTYRITIAEANLRRLNANPWTSKTFPAEVEFEGEVYSCQVRFRGASARNLPKKSWKLFFDRRGPRNYREVNLNSEYRDISISRNHLAMELADFLSLDAPRTRHVSLVVNNVFYGVFLEIEEVDRDFFDRRGIEVSDIVKAVNHGARFAPMIDHSQLPAIYNPKIVIANTYDTLAARLSFMNFSEPGSDYDELKRILDIDDILNYFAIQYCIVNWDGFSKNFYLARRTDGNYTMVPWDCDATFGNSWEGIYIGYESCTSFSMLQHQAVFQQLIAVPQLRDRLHVIIEEIITDGFDHLAETLDESYARMRHDAMMDTAKRTMNEEFLAEKDRLAGFLAERAGYLANLDWFHRVNVSWMTFQPDYVESVTDTIHLELKPAGEVFDTWLELTDSLNVRESIQITDGGLDGDEEAGDGIYSVDFSLEQFAFPVKFGLRIRSVAGESYPTPPAGWIYLQYYSLPAWEVRLDPDPPDPGDFQISQVSRDNVSKMFYFGITNTSEDTVDISGCSISINRGYRRIVIPETEPLAGEEEIFASNEPELAGFRVKSNRVLGPFYFNPEAGDTLFLTTSSGRVLASRRLSEPRRINEIVGSVVVNEINYNSADDFECGDWIELYSYRVQDLGGWQLRDMRDDHVFTIPDSTIIESNGYLVIAVNPAAFRTLFPDNANAIGGFDFGFSADGDDVRLFDANGSLVDWVSYDDDDPWLPEPDGSGRTLELENPCQPNFNHVSWRSSISDNPHGTPGSKNSVFRDAPEFPADAFPDRWRIISTYPNPFNGLINIRYAAPESGEVLFSIYDCLGRRIVSFDQLPQLPGEWVVQWDGSGMDGTLLPNGTYFIRMDRAGTRAEAKVIFLK